MIYTVTLNPTLDITYLVDRIKLCGTVKAIEVIKSPGGKGINVSRVLRAMGTDSIAITLIGGFTGEEVLSLLHEESLILQIVKIENETRTNVIIRGRDDGQELVIRAAGPPVKETETERINRIILRMTTSPEVLVISGSLPPGIGEDIYFKLITEGKKRGSRVILDAEGEPFRIGIESAPHIVKPNKFEIETFAGRTLDSENDLIAVAREIIAKGVEVVVISLGAEGALWVSSDTVMRGWVPKIEEDAVGAGDSMVAGIVMGLVQGESSMEVFHRGLACALASVMSKGPALATPEFFEKASRLVNVDSVK